jgi:hypothetical protein
VSDEVIKFVPNTTLPRKIMGWVESKTGFVEVIFTSLVWVWLRAAA